jgi:cell division protein FtsW (lipid II flippase)
VQQRSSIVAEIGWLAYFFAIFVILVYVLNIFVVPHHFNDKIADVFAAGMAAIIMIATRARWPR